MQTPKSTPARRSRGALAAILIIVLLSAMLGIAWMVWSSINSSIHNALSPLEQTNKSLSTQVSNLLHPTPTIIPDPVTIIHQVQALNRLETIQYTIEKVITAQENQGVLKVFLGDKLLFVAHGYVIAGIDMSKMEAKDLWLQDGVLNVRLPAAEILVSTLDNNKSYVYDRQTGILTKADPNLETSARQVAETEIRQAAIDDGILDQAEANAQTSLRWFFESLGYKQIKFVPLEP
jgi:hypothetical protein